MSAAPTTDTGMSGTTKALLWIGGIAAAAFILPRLLESAADNPERLRRSAKAIRRGRERAIELGERGGRAALRAGQRGLTASRRYLAAKLAD